jgi:hypothetical protein
VCIYDENIKQHSAGRARAKQTLYDSNWPVLSSTKIFTFKSLADVDDRVIRTITIKLAVCLPCINKLKGRINQHLKYWSSLINVVNCAVHKPSPGTSLLLRVLGYLTHLWT